MSAHLFVSFPENYPAAFEKNIALFYFPQFVSTLRPQNSISVISLFVENFLCRANQSPQISISLDKKITFSWHFHQSHACSAHFSRKTSWSQSSLKLARSGGSLVACLQFPSARRVTSILLRRNDNNEIFIEGCTTDLALNCWWEWKIFAEFKRKLKHDWID